MSYKHPKSFVHNKNERLTFPIPYCIMQECFLALNSPSEPAPLQGSWETSLSWEKWRIQTLQKVRGRAPSSATLHSLKRFAGMHIFHSSPSIVSQVWKDLHQNIRARSHTSVPWDPDTVLGRKSSWKAGFESYETTPATGHSQTLENSLIVEDEKTENARKC